jgi:predicted ATPase
MGYAAAMAAKGNSPRTSADLPTGVVTFMFTDIEGSTRLLRELGETSYGRLLSEHQAIFRRAVSQHGGVEVDTQGDAFFVAFARARDAVSAAADAQSALAGSQVRVRIGIHTGAAQRAAHGYVGADVHLAARIAAAAHGGQVVMSQRTIHAVDGDAAELGVTDLGEHRLKDFDQAVVLYQLGGTRFPPLNTISNTNLPRPASSLVGRQAEVEQVVALLQDGARLLTLIGPGGTGKTRLAIEAASQMVGRFNAGVFWVDLTAAREPAHVEREIEQTLGTTDGLAKAIGAREMLLALDNFEQVIAAAPQLPALLSACPNLRFMVTSRERLRTEGEVAYPVLPLDTAEAVRLFCSRAGVAREPAVDELCRRLDCLPLAVELAAGRASALSPRQILERLAGRLDMLKGTRGADPRQQTLRATIAWSHDLLNEQEQAVFARCGAFAGGWTLAAAEQVCDADIDDLQSLVDKSLVAYAGERFSMLETIREFAVERLRIRDDYASTRDRHMTYFTEFADRAFAERYEASSEWGHVLYAERDNIRAALDWSVDHAADAGTRLASGAANYWLLRGWGPETRDRLTAALARHEVRDAVRARALVQLGEALGEMGQDAEAVAHLEEALTLGRELDDTNLQAWALEMLGYVQIALKNLEQARSWFQAMVDLGREPRYIDASIALAGLCQVAMAGGDADRLKEMAIELYEIADKHGAERMKQSGLAYQGDAALLKGHYVDAERRYLVALEHAYRHGYRIVCPSKVVGIAMSVIGQGDPHRGLSLAGAAYAELEAMGVKSTNPYWEALQEKHVGRARSMLGPDEAERAETAGRELDFEAVVDDLLAQRQ